MGRLFDRDAHLRELPARFLRSRLQQHLYGPPVLLHLRKRPQHPLGGIEAWRELERLIEPLHREYPIQPEQASSFPQVAVTEGVPEGIPLHYGVGIHGPQSLSRIT